MEFLPPEIRPFKVLEGVFNSPSPTSRLKLARERGRALHKMLMGVGPVPLYASFELVRVPYPTKYAFFDVPPGCLWSRYVHIVNRVFVVRFNSSEGVKTLLVSPSDVDRNAETPFFKAISRSMGPLRGVGEKIVAPRGYSVLEALSSLGIKPEDVDYITYDHLHTQDLRRWLGTTSEPGILPKAKLLVTRQEWISTKSLIPPQEPWYCPNGINELDPARIILLDNDVFLGEGVALMRTPGHTEGNHSVAVRTPEGVMVTSENGVGPDAYAPLKSEIKQVRNYAERTGMEVVLNGNTKERGLDQYVSMVLEKSVAGTSVRDERFPNVVCSSEFASFKIFPLPKPTFCFGDLYFSETG